MESEKQKKKRRKYVKKRDPVNPFLNVDDCIKEADWMNEVTTSVRNMARKCYCLNVNKEAVVNEVCRSFSMFVATGFTNSLSSSLTTPYSFWNTIRLNTQLSQHVNLARLAMSLIHTLASESPCERLFSKMRILIGDNRFNLSPITTFHMFVIRWSKQS
jgi:hypothetical protein